MPELPEVEVLVRHLRARVEGRRICEARVLRPSLLESATVEEALARWVGRRIEVVRRRGKYIWLGLAVAGGDWVEGFWLHLGMTGRLWLQPQEAPLPLHTRAFWDLEDGRLVFSDPRALGRCGFGSEALERLGPEPLDRSFTAVRLHRQLGRSRQSLKVRLMDQTVVAGLGNIYVCESLWEAGLSPFRSAETLGRAECVRLAAAIRRVLRRAIRFGSGLELDWAGTGRDRLFYFGRATGDEGRRPERFAVYEREGRPCRRCGASVRRVRQAGRSTYYCPVCQV
jgi:formamidopyrimidine-DNA glycosylase